MPELRLSQRAPTGSCRDICEHRCREQTLCFKVPALLKRLYVEVGNGGWGPGYGSSGAWAAPKDDLGETAVRCYVSLRERSTSAEPSWRWPAGLLPLCHWGCAIYSCIDCTQPAVSRALSRLGGAITLMLGVLRTCSIGAVSSRTCAATFKEIKAALMMIGRANIHGDSSVAWMV